MKALIKNIIFLVSLIALVAFGYVVFFKDDTVVLDEETLNQARLGDEEFLAKLKDLQDLDLETSLFDDEEFLSLVDHTVQVVDEEAGRPNPFAPVPGLETKPKAK
jgi:energy-coupling factor transporter ATP-binding protein EcfA2